MKKYLYIVAWGQMLNSFQSFIDGEVARANRENAPDHAIYWDSISGWATFDDITSSYTRQIISDKVELLSKNEFPAIPCSGLCDYPAEIKISVTDMDGIVLDHGSYCRNCAKDGLDGLSLTAGQAPILEQLKSHDCPPYDSWIEYDAQGIRLEKVCDVCVRAKLSKYRPEILTGYDQSDVDEPIEPEDY